ncbi:MAG: ATP-binding protein [Candidatus Omnitrophica bacterium]|nr:ATP-binding protein [Candidatus Omnitrophota bacterium]
MAKEYSPFTPGVPVPIDFFVGRAGEVRAIVDKAKSACVGRIERIFVYGERGIGKSSLCRMARVIAEKDGGLLGVHVFLGGVNSLQEMVRRIFEKILKDNIDRPWYQEIRSFLGQHVREVGLFGVSVEFNADVKELTQLVNQFASSLRRLIQHLGHDKKGIMLILDDINGIAGSEEFANWLKSLVDEIATSDQPLPLLLVLVGLPERRAQLLKSQPSLARVFDPVDIKKLSQGETNEFYQQSFLKVGIRIDKEALDTLWRYSGGYPVLAHEIGDAVFKVDVDNVIDDHDALQGVLRAADVIGQKYIEPQVYDAIRSQRYRSILRKLANKPFETQFKRKDAVASLNPDEAGVFDNFLIKMKKLGVLMEDKDTDRGGYKFTSDLQYLFMWLEAQRAKEDKIK